MGAKVGHCGGHFGILTSLSLKLSLSWIKLRQCCDEAADPHRSRTRKILNFVLPKHTHISFLSSFYDWSNVTQLESHIERFDFCHVTSIISTAVDGKACDRGILARKGNELLQRNVFSCYTLSHYLYDIFLCWPRSWTSSYIRWMLHVTVFLQGDLYDIETEKPEESKEDTQAQESLLYDIKQTAESGTSSWSINSNGWD